MCSCQTQGVGQGKPTDGPELLLGLCPHRLGCRRTLLRKRGILLHTRIQGLHRSVTIAIAIAIAIAP